MLVTEEEKRICEKYGSEDEKGHVHCFECPLNKGNRKVNDYRCKANSSYNLKTSEWEYNKAYEIQGTYVKK